MTTYYVDPVNGNDGNNGLGPDASHASNKPYASITKVLVTTPIASGDTVYLAPGTYRETVTVTMTSATAETKIIGDVANSRGFKTSGGVLVGAGDVIWTAHVTNDTTVPGSTTTLGLNGRDYLTFENIVFVGGASTTVQCVHGATATSTNITFTDCTFFAYQSTGPAIAHTTAFGAASSWLINRCRFIGRIQTQISINCTRGTGSDYDIGFIIRNSILFMAGSNGGILVSGTGSGANLGNGAVVENCTFFGAVAVATGANTSTTYPTTVNNCLLMGCGLSANASSQMTESHCLIYSATPRTNVSAGTGSVSTGAYSPIIEIGQSYVTGRMARPMGTPIAGSPMIGFDAASSPPTVDLLGRPRPSGDTLLTVGALERHDTGAAETTTVDAGGIGLKITGPGDQDIKIPVAATATIIAIKARYDTTHTTTNKPQAILLANGELGITTETKTMTAAADTWETLTFASQTPSKAGVVTIRLVSRSTADAGKAFFDTVTVA